MRQRVVRRIDSARCTARIALTAFGVSDGIRLQHQRDRAADDGRGHARAAQAEIRQVRGRHACRSAGTARADVYSVLPGRSSDSMPTPGATRSGFAPRSIGRRAARAERRDRVVGAVDRAHVARCADSQHPRRVAGRRDAAVLRAARRRSCPLLPAAATTTMPGVDGALRGERQRIGVVRLVHAGRDRQIDDPDVEARRVARRRSRARQSRR